MYISTNLVVNNVQIAQALALVLSASAAASTMTAGAAVTASAAAAAVTSATTGTGTAYPLGGSEFSHEHVAAPGEFRHVVLNVGARGNRRFLPVACRNAVHRHARDDRGNDERDDMRSGEVDPVPIVIIIVVPVIVVVDVIISSGIGSPGSAGSCRNTLSPAGSCRRFRNPVPGTLRRKCC